MACGGERGGGSEPPRFEGLVETPASVDNSSFLLSAP